MQSNRNVYFIGPADSCIETETLAATLQSLGIAFSRIPGGVAGLGWLSDRAPGCLIVDIDTPGLDAAAIPDALPGRNVSLPVVVVSTHSDTATIVQSMRSGARDFLTKPLDRDLLAASLARLFDRLSGELERYRRQQVARNRIEALTDREHDILRGLIAGGANKTLAYQFGISIRTIEMHRSNLMAKLGVNSLAQAICLTFDSGIDLIGCASTPLQQRRRG